MASKQLKVLLLAAEVVPLARVGGVGDVVGALPKALAALGHDVRVMMPRYGSIRSDQFSFQTVGEPFPVPVGRDQELVTLVTTLLDGGVPVYLVWDEKFFFRRDKVYGFDDDPQRFTFFGRAVIAALKVIGWQPDVIHGHGWQTALVPTWLAVEGRREPFYRDIATVHTIHNLAHQGMAGRLILTFAALEDRVRHLPVERPGMVNWMAQGIAHADIVSTVSPTYARQILEPEWGQGLDPLLRERRKRLCGVLNGIDTDLWNPTTDPHIAQPFDARHLEARALNKAALQEEAGLPVRDDMPLLGVVSHLVEYRGFDIMEPALDRLLEGDVQFVLMGKGELKYHRRFRRLERDHPDKVKVYLKMGALPAQHIYAGADCFLMPSHFEPCGLGQMMAMRYGCVPVVRATGGLADTVVDYHAQPKKGTGFTFAEYTAETFLATLERALRAWQDREVWQELQRRGMRKDFSWKRSARKYVKLYRKAIQLHKGQARG